MAIAHVQTVDAAVDSPAATTLALPAMSVSTGNFIHTFCKWETNNNSSSVTDTAGNSYTRETRIQYSGTSANLQGAYAGNIAAHATNVITWTFAANVDFRRASATEYSGVATASFFDQQNQSSGSSTSVTSGNITTTQADEVVCGAAGTFTSTTFSSRQVNSVAATTRSTKSDYTAWDSIVSGTFTGAATCSISPSGSWAGAVASFKAAAAGGGGTAVPVFYTHRTQQGMS